MISPPRTPTLGSVSLAALLWFVLGCYGSTAVTPEELRAKGSVETLLITISDGSVLRLERPALSGDTLVGVARGREVMIPVSDLRLVQRRVVQPARTGLLLGGVAMATAVGIWGILQIGPQEPHQGPSSLPCRLDPGQPVDPTTGCDL